MSEYILYPIIAFLAMYCQDVLAVFLVRAEAQGRAWAAGRWDAAQDAFSMAGRVIGFGVILITHSILLSVLTVGATLAADFFGTATGVKLGVRLENRSTTNG